MVQICQKCRTVVPETEAPVQEKEFCPESEPISSNGSENDRHMTEENEYDDNKWYTFVANDKKQDLETDLRLESKENVIEKD